ncbi:MAG: PD40 domain-containing protein [Acidobacteria bacterium]|nr:PD40 domain-containing protein [Acidobacteriota bacterium]
MARRVPRWAIPAFAAALAGGAVLAFLATRKPPAGPPVWRPLTFRRGSIGGARFAPDGKTVVYSAAWQGDPMQLFTTRLDSTESTALPLPSANLAAVSSKGVLAIVLPREPSPLVAEVSLAGGAPRELVDGTWLSLPFAPGVADWAPGEGGLAVMRNWQLEFPVGKVLLPGRAGDGIGGSVRFSPDGKRIAFVGGQVGRRVVGVTDLDGHQTILRTGLDNATSVAWHPRTGEIWFSGREQDTRFGVVELRAITLAGKERVVARAPTILVVEDIAPDGTVLVRSDDWPTTMACRPSGSAHEVNLSWQDFSNGMDLSDDGRDLLFTESGAAVGANGAVYLRKTDGSGPAVRLGDGKFVGGMSRDGKWVVRVSPDRLVLLPVGPGGARTLQDEGLEYIRASWFPDGRRLLVEARERGKLSRLFVRDVAQGPPRPFTGEGFEFPILAPDGTIVVARDRSRHAFLVRVDGGAPQPVPGLGAGDVVLRFDASGKSLFVYRQGVPLRIERLDIATGARNLWKEIALSDPTGVDRFVSVQMTPDGSSYCYTVLRTLSRLYAVEGLR